MIWLWLVAIVVVIVAAFVEGMIQDKIIAAKAKELAEKLAKKVE